MGLLSLIPLLLAGAATGFALAVATVAWEALHPRRRTLAWALATGSPVDPEAILPPPRRGGASPEWRLGSVRAADGTALPFWEIAGGDPHGPVTVIVHGWGRSRWDSLRRAPLLLPSSSRVLLPDLRGHGEAGGTTRLGTIEPADLAAILDAEVPPEVPLLLVGHSMGAGVAIRAARSRRSLVAVVALAPYERVTTPIEARLRARALPSTLLAVPAVALLRLFGVRERPLSEAAATLTVPLLVATAVDDPITPAEDGRRIAAAAARGRFVALPGGDHADPGAGDPQAFARLVGGFVASLDGVTSARPASDAAG